MNALNAQIREPRQSSGNTLLKLAGAIVLIVIGFRIGHYTDTDWDRDGIPNEVETKYNMDPRRADSDGDGVRDNEDPYPLNPGISNSDSDTARIWLTTSNGKASYHPSDILIFKKYPNGYALHEWTPKGMSGGTPIQENLEEIEAMLKRIGYPHFYRVNRQDLANMLLAECLDKPNKDLCLSQEEDFWCKVSSEKLSIVEMWVDYRVCDTPTKN